MNRSRQQRMVRRAIARISLVILLVACTIGVANRGFAKQPDAPSLVAQARPAIDLTVARTTTNHLLQNAQNHSQQPEVYRTIVEGNYALATWRWGEGGGQAVLSKQNGRWSVLTFGGGAVNAATLQESGVPANIAQRLIERDQAAWQQR